MRLLPRLCARRAVSRAVPASAPDTSSDRSNSTRPSVSRSGAVLEEMTLRAYDIQVLAPLAGGPPSVPPTIPEGSPRQTREGTQFAHAACSAGDRSRSQSRKPHSDESREWSDGKTTSRTPARASPALQRRLGPPGGDQRGSLPTPPHAYATTTRISSLAQEHVARSRALSRPISSPA